MGFHNRPAMNVSQSFNFLAHSSDQIIDYSGVPRFPLRACQTLFIEVLSNPLHRSALSLKLSRFFPQWNTAGGKSVRSETQLVLYETNPVEAKIDHLPSGRFPSREMFLDLKCRQFLCMELPNKIMAAGNRPHGKGRLAARFPENCRIDPFLSRFYEHMIDDTAQNFFSLLKRYRRMMPSERRLLDDKALPILYRIHSFSASLP